MWSAAACRRFSCGSVRRGPPILISRVVAKCHPLFPIRSIRFIRWEFLTLRAPDVSILCLQRRCLVRFRRIAQEIVPTAAPSIPGEQPTTTLATIAITLCGHTPRMK
jgi:hypothetical protein